MSDHVIEAARAIRDQRYAHAVAAFAAGSIIRGEGTVYSDLDLVVVYANVPRAHRESFRFSGLPVEAFVHDPETLHYFFVEVDRPSGVPALPQMVAEGVEIPESSDLSRSLKALAASVLALGPPPLTPQDIDQLRYSLTDTTDDLRAPRSRQELIGTASVLFQELANFYLRTRGCWSAKGKAIPRALRRADAAFAARYCRTFEDPTSPRF